MEAGLPLFVLKRLLGHTSLSTTSKYLHVSREHLAQIKSPLDQPADPVPRRAPPSVAPSPTPYPARPSPKLAAVVSPFDELLTAAETLLSFGGTTSAPNWGSPPCCTPGAKPCGTTTTCTASSAAAGVFLFASGFQRAQPDSDGQQQPKPGLNPGRGLTFQALLIATPTAWPGAGLGLGRYSTL